MHLFVTEAGVDELDELDELWEMGEKSHLYNVEVLSVVSERTLLWWSLSGINQFEEIRLHKIPDKSFSLELGKLY